MYNGQYFDFWSACFQSSLNSVNVSVIFLSANSYDITLFLQCIENKLAFKQWNNIADKSTWIMFFFNRNLNDIKYLLWNAKVRNVLSYKTRKEKVLNYQYKKTGNKYMRKNWDFAAIFSLCRIRLQRKWISHKQVIS